MRPTSTLLDPSIVNWAFLDCVVSRKDADLGREVLTASGRSEPGLSWQSGVGGGIFNDAVVKRSGRSETSSQSLVSHSLGISQSSKTPQGCVRAGTDRHASERK